MNIPFYKRHFIFFRIFFKQRFFFLNLCLIPFILNAQSLSISGFNPKYAFPGQIITIDGINFNGIPSGNLLWLGTTKVSALSATLSRLEVKMPLSGSNYGSIRVLNTTTGFTDEFDFFHTKVSPMFWGSSTLGVNSFGQPIDIPIGGNPQQPGAVYDLDGDGKTDYFYSYGNTLVGIIQNLSSINQVSFGNLVGLSTLSFSGLNQAESVTAGDLDGDGLPEVLVNSSFQPRIGIFRNVSTPGTLSGSSFVPVATLTVTSGFSNNTNIELRDIDLDGKLDIVNGGVIFRNNSTIGNFQFSEEVIIHTLGNAQMVVADLNGDGKPEMIRNSGANILVYPNVSLPTTITASSFAASVSFAVAGTDVREIQVDDIDGDGAPDIIVNCGAAGQFSVLRNLITAGATINTGSFATKVDISTSGGYRTISFADLDGDLKIDMIEANGSGFIIRKNTVSGGTITGSSFSSGIQINGGAGNALGNHIVDINNDGILDVITTDNTGDPVVVLNQNHFTITPNKGLQGDVITLSGTNLPSVTGVKFGNTPVSFTISGTSILVLVPAPSIQRLPVVLENSFFTQTGNNFTYLFIPTITGFSPQTGDPSQQITITGNYFSNDINANIVWFGGVAGSITGASATQLVVKVPYGATYSPISVINLQSGLQASSISYFTPVFIGSNTFTAANFNLPDTYTTASAPWSVVVADMDLDGNNDILVVNNGANSFSIFRNTGSGFAAKVDYTMGGTPFGIAVGDIDGDGKPDVACVNQTGGIVSVFRNTAVPGAINASSLAPRVDFVVGGTNSQSVALADLDLDGRLDLTVVNSTLSQVAVLRNVSTLTTITAQSFAAPFVLSTGANSFHHVVGDIDGDGRLEIVVAVKGSNNVSIWRNTSNNTTLTASNFTLQTVLVGGGPEAVSLADLDGDGKLDLLSANNSSGNFSALRNQSTIGSISFGALNNYTSAANPVAIQVADMNGDSKPDVVVANQTGQNVAIAYNSAVFGVINASSFSAVSLLPLGGSGRNLALADVNRDGKADLISITTSLGVRMNNSSIGYSSLGGILGSQLSIIGSNFNEVTEVKFSSNQIATFSILNAQVILATIPGSAITGPVTVTNGYTTALGANFTVIQPPSITGFASRIGAFGNFVSIVGSNLDFATNVSFNGISASFYYNTLVGALFATVPTSITGSYAIGVQNVAANDVFAGYTFTVVSPPVLSDFNPKNVFPGEFITITGIGFSTPANTNRIWFGVVQATPISGNATQLIVQVPAGANQDFIEVYNGMYYARSKVRIKLKFIGNPNIVATDFVNQGNSPAFSFGNLRNMEVVDLDLDGRPDVLSGGVGGTALNVQRNTSSGNIISFGGTQTFNMIFTAALRYATFGDLNNDELPDAAVGNYGGVNAIAIIRNNSAVGSISFTGAFTLPGINNVERTVIIDIDGDGKKDIACINSSVHSIGVYLNKNIGNNLTPESFAPPVYFSTATFPTTLALEDLDGDGKPELVYQNAGNLFIRYNTSTIDNVQFGPIITISDNPAEFAFYDLDGDGKSEIIFSETFPSNNLVVYKNNANLGTFTAANLAAPVTYALPSVPIEIYVQDINADSKPDVLIAGTNNFILAKNEITGGVIDGSSFTISAHPVTTAGSYMGMRIADFNLDNKPDAVVPLNGNIFSIFRNNNTISYSTSSTGIGSVISIIGNNFEEVNSVKFFPNLNAQFQIINEYTIQCTVPGGASLGAIQVSNPFTTSIGPNFLPLVAPNLVQLTPNLGIVGTKVSLNGTNLFSITTLLGNNLPIVFSYNSTTQGISFDIPNALPIGAYSVVGVNSLFTSNTLVFNIVSRPTITGFAPQSAFPGEEITINGFGFNSSPANNIVLFGNAYASVISSSSTQLRVKVPFGAQQAAILVTDTENGLGDVTNAQFMPQFIGSNTIIGGNFNPAVNFTTNATPINVELADMDGDGWLDMVCLNISAPIGISIFRNIGLSQTITAASFGPRIDIPIPSVGELKIADIDNDGKLDLLARTSVALSGILILKNTSSPGNLAAGDFSAPVSFPLAFIPSSMAVGDIDKDGKIDLIANSTNSITGIYRNISPIGVINSNSFAQRIDVSGNSSGNSMTLADLNGDSKLDLICATNLAVVDVYQNQSQTGTITGTSFSAKTSYPVSANSQWVGASDMDGDGKLEVLSGNSISNNISILRNIHVSGSFTGSSFSTAVAYSAAGNANYVSVFDIDGDRKLDIITSNQVSNNLSLFRNTHITGAFLAGSFSTALSVGSFTSPRAIASGDIDNDGRIDVVIANSAPNNLAVFRNMSNITVNPNIGLEGANVSLLGSNLGRASQVVFNATGTGAFNTLSGFVLTVNVPTGAQTGFVQARNDFYTTPGVQFTVVAPPTITGVNPIFGPIGQSVTISGLNISFISNLSVNGFATVIQTIIGDNLVFNVPATLTSGLVLVQNPAGTGSGFSFTVYRSPTVSGIITPYSDINTIITINGANFNTDPTQMRAVFDKVTTTVLSSVSNRITAQVPLGAGFGSIRVQNLQSGLIGQSVITTNGFSPSFIGSNTLTALNFTSVNSLGETSPGATETADIDGDGWVDVAICNGTNVSIYRNLGTGSISGLTFAPVVNFTGFTSASSVAFSDLDGDGRQDMMVSGGTASLFVLKNICSPGNIDAGSFAVPVTFTTSNTPNHVAVGDIDGDGRPEILVANSGAPIGFSIYRNICLPGVIDANSFAPRVNYTVTNAANPTLALADLNADGKLDVVLRGGAATTLLNAFRNTFTGIGTIIGAQFASPVVLTAGTTPRSVQIADINQDGRPEVLVANSGLTSFSVFQNNSPVGGVLTFAAGVMPTIGTGSLTLRVADMDGDSRPDILVANGTGNSISVIRNLNTSTGATIALGTFATQFTLLPGTSPSSLSLADFDNDGRLDIFVPRASTNVLFKNNSTINYSPTVSIVGSTISILGSDFTANNTSVTSVLFAPGITAPFIINNSSLIITTVPSGAITGPITITNGFTTAIGPNFGVFVPPPVITDFNPKFGNPGTIITIIGTGFGAIASDNKVTIANIECPILQASPTSIVVRVSRGITLDYISVLNKPNFSLGVSTAKFLPSFIGSNTIVGTALGLNITPKLDLAAGTTPISSAIGDLDGDGKPDLVVANSGSGNLSVYYNISNTSTITATSFSTPFTLFSGPNPRNVIIADFTSDGKPDIACVSQTANNVQVYMNQAILGTLTASNFASTTTFATGNGPQSLVAIDIDRDGKLDIATANGGSNNISILRNNSAGGFIAFAPSFNITAGSLCLFIDAGDLDGDGIFDLVVANGTTNNISVFRNSGLTSTVTAASFDAIVNFPSGSTGTNGIVLVDIDMDNKLDIAASNNTATNNVSILKNQANPGIINGGSLATAVIFSADNGARNIIAGDIDGDNKPELIVACQNSNTISIFKNNATALIIDIATFLQRVSFPTNTTPLHVRIGDIDGDGRTDIVTANNAANFVSIFRNVSTISYSNSFAEPNTTFNILGSSFSNNGNVTNVLFAPNNSASFSIGGDEIMLVTVPIGAISGPVTVTNGLTTAIGPNLQIQARPSITGLSPIRGAIGTYITISGIGFAAVSTVQIAGISMPNIVTVTNSFIIFSTLNTVSGLVGVANLAGSSTGGNFDILFAPSITGISPLSADPGREITINGVNFSNTISENKVFFGTLQANIVSASATQIIATLPFGSGISQITVLNTFTGLYDKSSLLFRQQFIGNTTITNESFGTPISNSVGITPTKSIIADFNLDGGIDIAAVSSGLNIAIFENIANSYNYQSLVNLPHGGTGGATQIASGDLNQDGYPDIITGFLTDTYLTVLENKGMGGAINPSSFHPYFSITGLVSNQFHAEIEDIDNDGRNDIIYISGNSVRILRNIHSGGQLSAASFENANVNLNLGVGGGNFFRVYDFDKDGRKDIVATSASASNLYLFKNNTNIGTITSANFSAASTIAIGTNIRQLQIADIDADNNPDLAVCNGNQVSVLRNIAVSGIFNNTSFSAPVNFPIPAPFSMSFSDYDGDNRADLAVSFNVSQNVQIFRNAKITSTITSASFENVATTIPSGNFRTLHSVDINKDGKVDLFGDAQLLGGQIIVIPNLSLLTYSPTLGEVGNQISILGSNFANANYSVTSVSFAPNQNATFSIQNSSFILATVPSGAITGLITVTNGYTTNTGLDFTLIQAPSITGFSPTSGGLGQAVSIFGQNLLGVTFVGFGNLNSQFSTLNSTLISAFVSQAVPGSYPISVSNTQGSFTFSGYNYTVVSPPVITDFNPKTAFSGQTITLTGSGFGTMPTDNKVWLGGTMCSLTSSSPTQLLVTVPTRIGKGQLTVLNTVTGLMARSRLHFVPKFIGSNLLSSSLSGLSFEPMVDIASGGASVVKVSYADLDGDGKPDMIISNETGGGTISIARNTSNTGTINGASFSAGFILAASGGARFVAAEDFDGDGKLDLAVNDATNNNISIFRNISSVGSLTSGSFAAVVTLPSSPNPAWLAAGDLDGDGKIDLACTNPTSNVISLYRNLGLTQTITSSSFSPPVTIVSDVNRNSIEINDMDGDGKSDIVLSGGFSASDAISLYLNTSTMGTLAGNSFAPYINLTTHNSPAAHAIADIDGDGKLDIGKAAAGFGNTSGVIWRNQSTAGTITGLSFDTMVDFNTSITGQSVSFADLNGDGKLDYLIPGYIARFIGIYQNRSTVGGINISSMFNRRDYATPVNEIWSADAFDVDGDQRPELITANYAANTVGIWRNINTISYNTTFAGLGQTISIIGTSFDEVSSVLFAPNLNTPFSILNSSTIVATVPSLAITGPITVTNGYYTAVGPNLAIQQTPSILGFNPKIGALGNAVSIAGYSNGFALVTSVGFNGINASFTYNSVTGSIMAIVPTSVLGTYSVSVRSQFGGHTFTGYLFTVVSPPVITDFNPKYADPGVELTITGTGFGNNISENIVRFGGQYANILSATNTSIKVLVPAYLNYDEIIVQNTQSGLAGSSKSFAQNPRELTPVFIGSNTITSDNYSTSSTNYAGFSNLTEVLSADLDRDGKQDLILTDYGASLNSIFRNTATLGTINGSSFAPKVDYPLGYQPYYLTINDFDGDGKLDIVSSSSSNNLIGIQHNTSSIGTFTGTSFAPVITLTSSPWRISSGDLNGDGKPEIITSAPFSSFPSIYINRCTSGTITGTSFLSTAVSLGSTSRDIKIHDIDLDGKLDLIGGESAGLRILKNNTIPNSTGSINFGSPVNFTSDGNIQNIAIGDIDGDSFPDIVTAHSSTNPVSVFRNLGLMGTITGSSFSPKVSFPVPFDAQQLRLIDVNGDGKLDIVSSSVSSSATYFRLNTATAGSIDINSFTAPITISGISGFNSHNVDIDGDGRPEIVLGVTSLIRVRRNISTISYASPAAGFNSLISILGSNFANANYSITSVAFAPNVNAQFSIINSSLIVCTVPNAAITGPITVTNGFTTAVGPNFIIQNPPPVITDFNPKAADPGMEMTISGTGFSVVNNQNIIDFNGIRTVPTASTSTQLILKIPISASYGHISVLNLETKLVGSSDRMTILPKQFTPVFIGSNTITSVNFGNRADFTSNSNPNSITMGDLDGDGKPEMASSHTIGTNLALYYNLSSNNLITTSSFSPKIDFAVGSGARIVKFADLNNDGKPEVLAMNQTSNTVSILINISSIGGISLEPKFDISVGSSPNDMEIADIDGDGLKDIVVNSNTASQVIVYRTLSIDPLNSSSFAPGVTFTVGTNPYGMEIGDYDGDGRPDILTSNVTSNNISILRNTAVSGTITSASFDPVQNFNGVTSNWWLALGDLNNDGKIDIATSNNTSNNVSIYRNLAISGTITGGSVGPRFDFASGNNTRAMALGDIDGNGMLELVNGSNTSGQTGVYRNRIMGGVMNSSSFSPLVGLTATSTPIYAYLMDADGDGRTDIAAVNNTFVYIFQNFSTISYANSIAGVNAVVSIQGSNFTNATQVKFAPNLNSTFIISNSSLIITTVPSGAITGPITVTNGFTTAVGADFIVPVPPSITGFSPNSGPLGTRLTITGANLADVTFVGFNGISQSFTILSSQALAVTVFSTSGVNQVSVSNSVSSFTFGGYNFTVISAPVISDFNPKYISQGQEITINGANFASVATQGVVFVGPVRASITGGNTTTVKAIMPRSTGYFPITYHHLGNNLLGESSLFITPTFVGTNTISSSQFTRVDIPSVGANQFGLKVADFNLDGKPDVLASRNTASSFVLMNTSSNTTILASNFTTTSTLVNAANQQNISVGDINGDGSLDALAAITANSIGIYQNLNTASASGLSFGGQTPLTISSSIVGLEHADLDGDGKQDIIYSNNAANQLFIYKNIHTGNTILGSSFLPTFTIAGVNSPQEILKADFDGDGKIDISFVNFGSNNFSVYRNISTIATLSGNSFGALQNFATGTGPQNISVGDIDGDTKFDVVVTNSTANTISVFRNTSSIGNISFAAKVDFSTGSQPLGVGIGDVNGDGKPEVIVSNNTSNTISIFRNTSSIGNISFAAKVDMVTGTNPRRPIICDMDADGKSEILVAHNGTTYFTIFKNNVSLITTLDSPTVSGTSFCSGNTMTITYSGTGAFDFSNNFIIELSSANGTFPGTSFATIAGNSLNGVLTVTAPSFNFSSNYRLRLRSTNPISISPSNSINLTINTQPTVTGYVTAVACEGSSLQLAVVTAGGIGGYTWTHSGTGTLDNNASAKPVYSPSANETGVVEFYMTPLGIAPCFLAPLTLTSVIIANTSNIIYVNATATGTNNGTSWINAYTNLQSALSSASCGSQIWVATGVYKPTSSADRTISFELKNGVNIYGGFMGFETDISQRNLSLSGTSFLSGDIGTPVVSADNSYHVVTAKNVDKVIVDGFTITRGNANGVGADELIGAGILMKPSAIQNPVKVWFKNIKIIANGSGSFGGGVYIGNNTILGAVKINMENCLFSNNTAVAFGGAIYSEADELKITNATIAQNQASGGNASIYLNTINGFNVRLRNSIVFGNTPTLNQLNNGISVDYSNIEGGYAGDSNINSNPLFVDPDGVDNNFGNDDDNYRLQAGSPSINLGTITGAPATDIVQSLRSCQIDMGAYEFDNFNVGLYDNYWTGCSSTDWFDAGNWSQNVVPTTRQTVYIPGTDVIANQPNISSGAGYCFTITLDVINGASLIIGSSGTLDITKP
jgi:predicted outer membrane repeat protein